MVAIPTYLLPSGKTNSYWSLSSLSRSSAEEVRSFVESLVLPNLYLNPSLIYLLSMFTLLELFSWTEDEFLSNTEGSPIRRIGYECWLRNIAVALGNSTSTPEVIDALTGKTSHASKLVREHVQWALEQHN